MCRSCRSSWRLAQLLAALGLSSIGSGALAQENVLNGAPVSEPGNEEEGVSPATPPSPAPDAPAASVSPPAPVTLPAPVGPPAPVTAVPHGPGPLTHGDGQGQSESVAAAVPVGSKLTPQVAVTAPTPAAKPDEKKEEIIVTGSAIRRKDLITPAPVTILNRMNLEAAGMVSIGDILQDLPAQSNAINTQANNGGDGSTRVSLRGLGTTRTLVLVNGRRHVPGGSGANASVDLNAIPVALIERVEVLKDGASALYGSDAIGGVINIITRQNFDGSSVNFYTGTARGGATVYDVNVTTGLSNEDGYIGFSAGYYRQAPMFAGARTWAENSLDYRWRPGPGQEQVKTLGSTAVPQGYVRNRGSSFGSPYWQALRGSASSPIFYHDPSVGWRDFNSDGTSDIPAGKPGGGDMYNYQPENYLQTPQQRYNIFATGAYQFNDNARSYFEASYLNRRSDQKLAPTPLLIISEGIQVAKDNYYNPFGANLRDVRRRFLEAGNRNFLQDIDTFRLVLGMDGYIPHTDFRWDVFFNYGRTAGTSMNEGRFVRSRVERALGPSFVDSTGIPRCGTLANPGPSDCVPLNLFGGPGTITRDMLKYISYTGTLRGLTQHRGVQAQTSGELLTLPMGGPVGLAFGLTHRRLDGVYIPDPITASGDTTGNKVEPTIGGYDVSEGFAELSAVLLQDQPGAETLELLAATRAFRYNTFGNGITWKGGTRWQLFRDLPGVGSLALRGTYSTAFRAPTIGQMFSGQYDSFPAVTDPCDTSQGARSPIEDKNCKAAGLPDDYVDDRTQIRTRKGGNVNLDPETANIWTAGLVYEPGFVPGLSLTVDAYSIKVENAIQPIGASILLSNCYAQANATACDQIMRDGTGYITNIVDVQQNIGGNETAGVDIGLAHILNTSIGRLRSTFDLSYLRFYNEIQPAADMPQGRTVKGRDVYDLGVYPMWRARLGASWQHKGFGAGLNARYIQGFSECEDDDCNADLEEGEELKKRRVSANFTADLYASFTNESPSGRTEVAAGINNILNARPPVIYNGFAANTDTNTYDFLGRYPYVRITHSF